MANYELPYHTSKILLDIPGKNVLFYRSVTLHSIENDNRRKLRESLAQESLKNFTAGRRVCLVIEDVTREVPLEDLLKATAGDLQSAAEIIVLIATGTHEGENRGNYKIVEAVRRTAVQKRWNLISVTIHNCHSDRFLFVGQTQTNKNKVYVNAVIERAEVITMSRRGFQLGRLATNPVGIGCVTLSSALTNDDDVFQKLGFIPNLFNNREQGLMHNQHSGPAVLEHIGILLRREQGVHADGNPPDFKDTKERRDPLWSVKRENANKVAYAYSPFFQGIPHLVNLVGDLLKGHIPLTAVKGHFIGSLGQVAL